MADPINLRALSRKHLRQRAAFHRGWTLIENKQGRAMNDPALFISGGYAY
jgi:hypothetical protein